MLVCLIRKGQRKPSLHSDTGSVPALHHLALPSPESSAHSRHTEPLSGLKAYLCRTAAYLRPPGLLPAVHDSALFGARSIHTIMGYACQVKPYIGEAQPSEARFSSSSCFPLGARRWQITKFTPGWRVTAFLSPSACQLLLPHFPMSITITWPIRSPRKNAPPCVLRR